MSRILITGGSGMVAQHVAEAAVAAGHKVVLADVAFPQERMWFGGGDRVVFDVRDGYACRREVRGAAAVVHCAAVVGPQRARIDPQLTLAVNVTGTALLLEAAHAEGARLLNVSTATLYGNRPDLAPLSETDAAEPLTVYDGSKLMSETWCTTHRRTFKSDCASFRTGFVYGRGNQIGEYFLPRVLSGEPIVESAGGDHPCDFTYVVDLAEALLMAATAPQFAHDVYNVTGGVLRTRGEFANAVRVLIPVADITQEPGLDPARHLRGPCVLDRARDDFGWQPRFTIEDGLSDWKRRLVP